MKKIIWIPLLVGGILVAGGTTLVACNTPKAKGIETPYDFAEKDIKSITTDLSISDVSIKVGESAKVICKESEKNHHEVVFIEDNNTLSINFSMNKKWYSFVDLFQPKFAVEIYLPAGTYETLNIKTSTGNFDVATGFTFASIKKEGSTGEVNVKANVTNKIYVKQSTGDISLCDMKAGEVELDTSTGKLDLANVEVIGNVKLKASTGAVKAKNVTCADLSVETSTGDIDLTNTVASGKASVKASTGDITLKGFDAAEVELSTSTGDIEAEFLTIKNVDASDTTDKKYIDKELDREAGGKCKVHTSTGKINLTLKR